jgi:hypothetical protein
VTRRGLHPTRHPSFDLRAYLNDHHDPNYRVLYEGVISNPQVWDNRAKQAFGAWLRARTRLVDRYVLSCPLLVGVNADRRVGCTMVGGWEDPTIEGGA